MVTVILLCICVGMQVSSQWWAEDIEHPEGSTLDELIETNNLCQLIDEPTTSGDRVCLVLILLSQISQIVL